MKTKLLALVFVISMVGAGLVQDHYDTRRDYFSRREVFVTLPPGRTLKILCFGYRNLAADMLFIWAIQFYSSYHITNSYDYLEQVFDAITDLNPQYKEPYIVGSWIMALEAGDVKMAMRLLQKGAANMPEEWIFDYECGFYAYKNLRDYGLAEKYFEKAAARPSAPLLIARKRAHMVYMENNLNYAYQLWLDIYNRASDQLERNAAYNHLHQIKFEIDKKFLEERLALFKKIHKQFPHRLEDLKRAGLIEEIPRDFDNRDYIYQPQEGTVTSRRIFQWKK